MGVEVAAAVTWAYFIIYIFLIFIVSIIFANKIKQEAKAEQTTQQIQTEINNSNLCTRWAKLLFRKRKCYTQLIPHFLDQATDIGVIIEYHRYAQEYGEEVGINVWYLFYTSIGVIIIHKIVSSFAIFYLTRNIKYIFYQLFDVLMIKCIWTNYELDTNLPSNAQRYLQIIEATFESAPQILICSAFLVKTTVEPSWIIYLSLMTSFWTLSARISGDDKVMMRPEWKFLDLSKKFPFMNLRYILRIVFWRFFEVSSRVVILCIMWINTGGVSVFVILGAEFLYLAILCFGLRSLDVMGNIVYLRAASENTKRKEWGVTFTQYFWIWRVLSAYIILIVSTIFALADFDERKIQDYETRHQQTIDNNIGFAFFMYGWIATPIWQWFGIIVVFDFKNLQTVSRDIEQLCKDDQWIDAMELIKFGAVFNEVHTFRMLVNSDNVPQKALDVLVPICIAKLIQNNFNFQEMLFEACKKNQSKAVKYLFDNKEETKVDVNGKDDSGRTPLFYAKVKGVAGVLTSQADCDCKTEDNDGVTALFYLFKECKVPLGVVQVFVEQANYDLESTDKEGNTVMQSALKTNQNANVQEFLAMKTNYELTNEDKADDEEKALHPLEMTRKGTEWINLGNTFTTSKLYVATPLVIFLCLVSVDIVLLIIEWVDGDCGEVEDVPFDVGIWLGLGCAFSIVWIGCVCTYTGCFLCATLGDWACLKECGCQKCVRDTFVEGNSCAGFCAAVIYGAWVIVGFVEYFSMDKDDRVDGYCGDFVLSWIILKCIVIVGITVAACVADKKMEEKDKEEEAFEEQQRIQNDRAAAVYM